MKLHRGPDELRLNPDSCQLVLSSHRRAHRRCGLLNLCSWKTLSRHRLGRGNGTKPPTSYASSTLLTQTASIRRCVCLQSKYWWSLSFFSGSIGCETMWNLSTVCFGVVYKGHQILSSSSFLTRPRVIFLCLLPPPFQQTKQTKQTMSTTVRIQKWLDAVKAPAQPPGLTVSKTQAPVTQTKLPLHFQATKPVTKTILKLGNLPPRPTTARELSSITAFPRTPSRVDPNNPPWPAYRGTIDALFNT